MGVISLFIYLVFLNGSLLISHSPQKVHIVYLDLFIYLFSDLWQNVVGMTVFWLVDLWSHL